MLHIYIGKKSKLWGVSAYFDSVYEPEWTVTDFAKRAIKEIDKSEVIAPRVIDSPFLGTIPPDMLSTGVKQLMLMESYTELANDYFNGDQLGDNVLPFVFELAKNRDIYLATNHYYRNIRSVDEFIIDNNGKTYRGQDGWAEAYLEFGS